MTSLLEKFRVGDKVTVPKSPVAQVQSTSRQVGNGDWHAAVRAYTVPTICPQSQVAPVICRDAF